MGIFNKLFGNKAKTDNPDNSKLLGLLGEYLKNNGSGDTYKNVVLELMNGNSFLMFPTQNDANTNPDQWTIAQNDTTLKLASVVNVDGLKVLGAFTDEQALLAWTKSPCQYTAMRSQDVLKFAQENGIGRIVINSDLPNMFVLERSKENVKEYTIDQGSNIQLGTPDRLLSESIARKLIDSFRKDNAISEVYQYGQTADGGFSIVLGIVLTTNSENVKGTIFNIVQNALHNETLDQNLDVFFIETESWLNSVKSIQNSLLYKKE